MKKLNHAKTHTIEQPTLRSSVARKLCRLESFRGSIRGVLVAAGLAAAVAAPAWASTHGAVIPDPVALENWRAVMAQNLPQEAGCFRESYPSLVREKVDCSTARPRAHPRRRTSANVEPYSVGNGNDYIAQTKEKIFWAGGNFRNVVVQSEASVGGNNAIDGPNEYSLQLNTNEWGVTSACEISPTFSCHVWQQFVYATDSDCGVFECGGGVFIQYWLLDSEYCPSGWNQDGANCFVDSNMASAPDFPITDLANLSLHAAAKAGGQDCVVVYDNTGAGWGVCNSDGVLDISSVWDKTEFGIFGDAGRSQAQFSSGTGFDVLLQVNDGSGAAPACHAHEGTTGETNNLTLGPCFTGAKGGGLYPWIEYFEIN